MPSRFLSSCPYYIRLETKDWKLLRDEMRTCAFSLSIFMSFFYTAINERLVVAEGRVPLAYVIHTGTGCAPVPSRFYLHVLATQNKNERLVFTQGRDAHLCLLAFYLHVLIIQNPKRKTGSYSVTRCTPVPSRFLSSRRRVPLVYVTHAGTRCAPVLIRFYLHVLATQHKK